MIANMQIDSDDNEEDDDYQKDSESSEEDDEGKKLSGAISNPLVDSDEEYKD
jgi:hypothetical protein